MSSRDHLIKAAEASTVAAEKLLWDDFERGVYRRLKQRIVAKVAWEILQGLPVERLVVEWSGGAFVVAHVECGDRSTTVLIAAAEPDGDGPFHPGGGAPGTQGIKRGTLLLTRNGRVWMLEQIEGAPLFVREGDEPLDCKLILKAFNSGAEPIVRNMPGRSVARIVPCHSFAGTDVSRASLMIEPGLGAAIVPEDICAKLFIAAGKESTLCGSPIPFHFSSGLPFGNGQRLQLFTPDEQIPVSANPSCAEKTMGTPVVPRSEWPQPWRGYSGARSPWPDGWH